ncbi:MAG: amino acid adenylation domain-containing protein [Chlamydiota bacterium]
MKNAPENDSLLPLTGEQYPLWQESQLYPDDYSYHFNFVAQLNHKISSARLQGTIRIIAEQRPFLRTLFKEVEGVPKREYQNSDSLELKIVECSNQEAVKQLAESAYQEPFDLLQELPARFILYKTSDGNNYLQVIIHHIALDLAGYIDLIPKIFEVYSENLDEAPAPSKDDDFALQQQQYLASEKGKEDLNYWKEYLSGELQPPLLPLHNSHSEYHSGVLYRELDADLEARLKKTAKALHATFFSLQIAAFQAFLHRYTGQPEVISGIPIQVVRSKASLSSIGYSVNTLPIRNSFMETRPFSSLVVAVSADLKRAVEHCRMPFQMIKEACPDASFQTMIVSQRSRNYHQLIDFGVAKAGVKMKLGDIELESIGMGHFPVGRTGLTLAVVETSQGYYLSYHFNALLYSYEEIERLQKNFQTFLYSIADNPHKQVSELSLLSPSEYQQVVCDFNDTAVDFDLQRNFIDFFERQCQQTPHGIAAEYQGEKISYQELKAKVDKYAYLLQQEGITRGSLVALCLDRGIDFIIAMVSVMKSGAAYLPLDHKQPAERLNYILENSKANLLVTTDEYKAIFKDYAGKVLEYSSCLNDWDDANDFHPSQEPNPDDLAYVIYTSGSTGQPKGVEVGNRALSNFLQAMQTFFQVGPANRWLAVTTVSFDIFNMEILLPLMTGATVVIADSATTVDPVALSQSIEDYKINIMQATPATWRLLVDGGWEGKNDLKILSGGEALPHSLAEALRCRCLELWNLYGPTETTIWSAVRKIENVDEKLNTAYPIANTTCYVLDNNLNPLPLGVLGELYIGGIGLAEGYRHRPDLTAERFIESPFDNALSSKLYKTGDIARYLPSGRLQFLGRADFQVKIRGFRIELGEIEAALTSHQEVTNAVVDVDDDPEVGKRLIAYYTGSVDKAEVNNLLEERLPAYMIPSAYIALESMPLTHNGKIDRKKLPKPKAADLTALSEMVVPRNEIEESLAEIWQEILKLERVSVKDHFIKLGGHSLLAAQVVHKINRRFQLALPLKVIFEKPTIELLAHEVADELSCTASEGKAGIKLCPRSEMLPLSYSQNRLWFLDQLEEHSPIYNVPYVVTIKGTLNAARLEKAINTVVERHEILRTSFPAKDGVPYQDIAPRANFRLQTSNVADEAEAQQEILKKAQKPFDITRLPLFRVALVEVNSQKSFMACAFHHIIFDGRSIELFLKEVCHIYSEKDDAQLPQLSIQYADYAYWEQHGHDNEATEHNLIDWWQKSLAGAPHFLNLPIDHPRPPVQTFRGALWEFYVPNEILLPLKAWGQTCHASTFMVLLAAFKVLLSRYSGQDDIIVGVPADGRQRPEEEKLLGCFINTLAFRTNLGREPSFQELVERVRDFALQAYAHQEVPFEELVDHLQLERSLSYSPLFQVMFNMLAPIDQATLGGLDISVDEVDRGMAHFDLSLSVQETPQGLKAVFEYSTDLFKEETIKRMSGHYLHLLESIIDNPSEQADQLPMLSPEELHTCLEEWNKPNIDYEDYEIVHEVFERCAAQNPDAIAVTYEGESWDYRHLNAKANMVAHTLLDRGVKPGAMIAICAGRTADFLAGILGIMKAGCAYVPIDHHAPQDKIAYILQDINPPLALTVSSTAGRITPLGVKTINIDGIEGEKAFNPQRAVSGDSLAYVIYTSGSTGKPKGVEISHASICDRVAWKAAQYPLDSDDVVLHTYSFIFDGSIINYLWPLCYGIQLVIASTEERLDSHALLELINHYRVTTVDLLPSLIHAILEEHDVNKCASLKTVFSGGEALSGEIVQLFYQKLPHAELHNTYGPTEATVEASFWPCERSFDSGIAPIGRPMAGARLYILDGNLNPVPVGVPGELYIGGKGLARAYLNLPGMTAEKFVPDPFNSAPGARMYRSGDIVKYRSDGVIDFIGRGDNQVKVSGFRIELGEIEAALMRHPKIQEALVEAKQHPSGQKFLAAYLILEEKLDESTNLTEMLKEELSRSLPEYMIPKFYTVMESYPTLLNGKIDRKSLPEPTVIEEKSGEIVPPEGEREERLLEMWCEILQLDTIGVTSNFFDFGGNSLLAVRLIARIRHAFQVSLPLASLFQHSAVRTLSHAINEIKHGVDWSPLVPIQSKGNKTPVFCIHPIGGNVLCYQPLAASIGQEHPFYGLQARGFEEGQEPYSSIESMAAEYVKEICLAYPQGPYFVGGWSFGGLVAIEVARQLHDAGYPVGRVFLLDASSNLSAIKAMDLDDEAAFVKDLAHQFGVEVDDIEEGHVDDVLANFIENGLKNPTDSSDEYTSRLAAVAKAHYRALKYYDIPALDVPVTLIKAEDNPEKALDLGWQEFVSNLNIHEIPGDHWTIFEQPNLATLSAIIKDLGVSCES